MPTKLTVASVNSDSVALNWAAPFDGHSAITSYTLYVYLGAAADNLLDDIVDGIEGTTYLYKANPATDYSFRVAAINALDESDESDAVEVTTTSRAPNAPTDVVVGDATPTSLRVSWKAPANNGGAEIT